jgi:hypothetical protein
MKPDSSITALMTKEISREMAVTMPANMEKAVVTKSTKL